MSPRSAPRQAAWRAARGFTLIEVLVALGIVIFWTLVRRRRPDEAPAQVKPARRRELEKLLDDDGR